MGSIPASRTKRIFVTLRGGVFVSGEPMLLLAFVTPGNLCNSPVHKFRFWPLLGKTAHVQQVAARKVPSIQEHRRQIFGKLGNIFDAPILGLLLPSICPLCFTNTNTNTSTCNKAARCVLHAGTVARCTLNGVR